MIDAKMLKRTVQNIERGTERGQTNSLSPRDTVRRLSKTHVDYWFSRLRKRSYPDRDGQLIEVPDWQVRLKKDGRESWFNLGTPNQAAAAKQAKDIYVHLEANGWDATLAKFKPETAIAPRLNLTVGEFLTAVSGIGYLRPRTFLNYQNSLRTIVSEVFGVNDDKSKFDYRHGGNQAWVQRIDSIRLERVTPARIVEWQKRRLKQAGQSPIAIASAKRTANSYVRCARSLFGKEIRKRLKDVQLPAVLPFDGVDLFESGSMKYVSKLNVQTIITAARDELKPHDPEAYKVFLLGLLAGMRKGEIDLAEWRMVDWQNHVIRLEETEFLHLKTNDSAGEIAIDPEVGAELQALKPAGEAKFIISSVVIRGSGKKQRTHTRAPRNDSARAYYRCEPVFDRLNTWLRSKGITANKPLHELRKEIGAQIVTKHGIFAASRFLRHSDITTTSRHYADHKERISVGLGKLLLTPETKPANPQG
jgi:integrase